MTEQMKPSGIAWIGYVPINWDIKRIKYLAALKGRIGWQGLTSDEYIDEGPYLITGVDFANGGIAWNNCVHISEKRWQEATEIQIQNGDLLITKDGTVGKVAVVTDLVGKASLNSGVLLIKTLPTYNRKFLYWVLQSEEFWTWFRLKNAGNSTIIHLYQNEFAEFSYTFPSSTEQQTIADFLDDKCAKIDSIISDIEKEIETLQKYKKSLITETVTKGLNKSAPMKDSGIEWIGSIPEHWETKKIKYISDIHSSRRIFEEEYQDDGIPFFRTKEISELSNNKDISLELFISEKRYNSLKQSAPKRNDLLISSIGTIGKVWVSDGRKFYYKDGNITQIDGNCKFESMYMSYIIKSDVFIKAIEYYESTTTISALTIEKIKRIIIPFCSLKEQRKIVNFLNKKSQVLKDIISRKQKQLETMQQHKKSLIYEYITGKRRVTEGEYNGN